MMSPAPPPVTPSRKLPPRFGVPPLVAVDVPPHAASGPASITPPANTPALISRRRRVSELVLRSPDRSIGVSAIDFLLLDVFTASPQKRLSRRSRVPLLHCQRGSRRGAAPKDVDVGRRALAYSGRGGAARRPVAGGPGRRSATDTAGCARRATPAPLAEQRAPPGGGRPLPARPR